MAIFGDGLTAARTVRARLLDRLGAEREWLSGEPDDPVVSWVPSVLATDFGAAPAAQHTPDLGVLRIVTDVSTVGDVAAGHSLCNALNIYTTTNSWALAGAAAPRSATSRATRLDVQEMR